MNSDLLSAGIMFIGLFTGIILIPCALIARIGFKMVTRLGRFPSKTPAIQLSIVWQLVAIEIISITCLLLVYHVLVDPNKKMEGRLRPGQIEPRVAALSAAGIRSVEL